MFITADQILAHLVGDYILQSHWMATEKTKQSFAAAVHAITYTLPFLILTQSIPALTFIVVTHFIIDRWRLARFVVWLKNGPIYQRWSEVYKCWSWERRPITATGYQDDVPPWLSVWLLIIADNVLHLICNGAALALFD